VLGPELTMRLVLILLLLAAPLAARTLKVGEEAPNFKANGDIINPPEFERTLDDCKGSVILVMEWSLRDPTFGDMKKVQDYYSKHAGKGLHIWTVYRLDFEKLFRVRKIAWENGFTFPICMGGFYDEKNDFFGYKREESGFRTTVVDIEGKVAFYGEKGWDAVLDKELAKLVYGGLGRQKVADPVAKIAASYAKRDFGKALKDAETLEAAGVPEAAADDHGYIVGKLKQIADTRNQRITEWVADKRYDLAMPVLEVLRDEFKGHKIGDDAKAQLDAIKKDKDAKKEIKAFEDLQKLIDKLKLGEKQMLVNGLKDFAKRMNTVRAGVVATKLAEQYEHEPESNK
jgi:hypothetical protein